MRTVIAAVAAVLLLASSAFAKESVKFQKWTYLKDKSDSGEFLRIHADSEAKEAPGGLLIYRDPGQCGNPGIVIVASTPRKGEAVDWRKGAMRVDEKSVHSFQYKVSFPRDDGMAVLNLKEMDNLTGLYDEMRQGAFLRVKVAVHGKDFIMRIPLAGYVEANAKQLEVCSAMPVQAGKKGNAQGEGKKREEKGGGVGTGFFVNQDGYVITNFHVVKGAKKVVCEYQTNKFDAKVVRVDAINDLALLKLETQPKAFLHFRAGKPIRPGEEVVAIGFPLYGMVSTHPNITTGTISSAVGLGDDTRLIQTTAPVQPGNSGGPLLDISGNVVGVVVSKLDALAVVKATGDIPQNINFAIRTPLVKSFLEINEVAFHSDESQQDLKVVEVGDKALPGVVLVMALPE